MVLSDCQGVMKYMLIFMNLIFWAVGLTTVVMAIWMLVDNTFIVSLTQQQQNYNAGLYIMLAAGSLLMIVSFLGCCGSMRESQCMLVAFFSCLLVVVVAQIAAGAWLYTNRERLDSILKDTAMYTVKHEYGVIESRTRIVDTIQSDLGCCGATGPADWAGSKYSRKDESEPLSLGVTVGSDNSYDIPKSCCNVQDAEICHTASKAKVGDYVAPEIYKKGCIDELLVVLKNQVFIFLSVIIGVGVLELLGLIFALVLCCAIDSSDRYKA